MAVIGRFTRDEAGGFVGRIVTLAVQSDVRITAPRVVGAPWIVHAGEVLLGVGHHIPGRDFRDASELRVELDDPSFAAPITAQLRLADEAGDDGFVLLWERRRAAAAA